MQIRAQSECIWTGQSPCCRQGELGALREQMTHTAGFILAKIKSRCSRSLWGLDNEGQKRHRQARTLFCWWPLPSLHPQATKVQTWVSASALCAGGQKKRLWKHQPSCKFLKARQRHLLHDQDGCFSGVISRSTSRMNRRHNSSCQGRATHCTATGSPTLFLMIYGRHESHRKIVRQDPSCRSSVPPGERAQFLKVPC